MRGVAGPRTADDLQSNVGAVLSGVACVNETDINVIACAEVQSKARSYLPVILDIPGKLLCAIAQVKRRIATSQYDLVHDAEAGNVGRRTGRGTVNHRTSYRTRVHLVCEEALRKLARVVGNLIRIENELVGRA